MSCNEIQERLGFLPVGGHLIQFARQLTERAKPIGQTGAGAQVALCKATNGVLEIVQAQEESISCPPDQQHARQGQEEG